VPNNPAAEEWRQARPESASKSRAFIALVKFGDPNHKHALERNRPEGFARETTASSRKAWLLNDLHRTTRELFVGVPLSH